MADERIRKNGESVVEWADRINGMRNTYKVHCNHYKLINGELTLCNEPLEAGQGRAVAMPWAGIRPRYFCEDCANMILNYHGNARRTDRNGIGTPKKGNLQNTTIGIEIEWVDDIFSNRWGSLTLKAILEYRFNVITESDCTVDGEDPTDFMFGANILSKNIHKLEKYGMMSCFDNSRCGGHMHVYVRNMNVIRNWYNTLFCPLHNYFIGHNAQWLIDNIGRDFGQWAGHINENTDCMVHSNFVNCQHNNTLEFRLPRIRSHKQYMNVVYFWREVGYMLNCVEWIADNGNNRNERKAQASNVAQSIVALAVKYFGA